MSIKYENLVMLKYILNLDTDSRNIFYKKVSRIAKGRIHQFMQKLFSKCSVRIQRISDKQLKTLQSTSYRKEMMDKKKSNTKEHNHNFKTNKGESSRKIAERSTTNTDKIHNVKDNSSRCKNIDEKNTRISESVPLNSKNKRKSIDNENKSSKRLKTFDLFGDAKDELFEKPGASSSSHSNTTKIVDKTQDKPISNNKTNIKQRSKSIDSRTHLEEKAKQDNRKKIDKKKIEDKLISHTKTNLKQRSKSIDSQTHFEEKPKQDNRKKIDKEKIENKLILHTKTNLKQRSKSIDSRSHFEEKTKDNRKKLNKEKTEDKQISNTNKNSRHRSRSVDSRSHLEEISKQDNQKKIDKEKTEDKHISNTNKNSKHRSRSIDSRSHLEEISKQDNQKKLDKEKTEDKHISNTNKNSRLRPKSIDSRSHLEEISKQDNQKKLDKEKTEDKHISTKNSRHRSRNIDLRSYLEGKTKEDNKKYEEKNNGKPTRSHSNEKSKSTSDETKIDNRTNTKRSRSHSKEKSCDSKSHKEVSLENDSNQMKFTSSERKSVPSTSSKNQSDVAVKLSLFHHKSSKSTSKKHTKEISDNKSDKKRRNSTNNETNTNENEWTVNFIDDINKAPNRISSRRRTTSGHDKKNENKHRLRMRFYRSKSVDHIPDDPRLTSINKTNDKAIVLKKIYRRKSFHCGEELNNFPDTSFIQPKSNVKPKTTVVPTFENETDHSSQAKKTNTIKIEEILPRVAINNNNNNYISVGELLKRQRLMKFEPHKQALDFLTPLAATNLGDTKSSFTNPDEPIPELISSISKPDNKVNCKTINNKRRQSMYSTEVNFSANIKRRRNSTNDISNTNNYGNIEQIVPNHIKSTEVYSENRLTNNTQTYIYQNQILPGTVEIHRQNNLLLQNNAVNNNIPVINNVQMPNFTTRHSAQKLLLPYPKSAQNYINKNKILSGTVEHDNLLLQKNATNNNTQVRNIIQTQNDTMRCIAQNNSLLYLNSPQTNINKNQIMPETVQSINRQVQNYASSTQISSNIQMPNNNYSYPSRTISQKARKNLTNNISTGIINNTVISNNTTTQNVCVGVNQAIAVLSTYPETNPNPNIQIPQTSGLRQLLTSNERNTKETAMVPYYKNRTYSTLPSYSNQPMAASQTYSALHFNNIPTLHLPNSKETLMVPYSQTEMNLSISSRNIGNNLNEPVSRKTSLKTSSKTSHKTNQSSTSLASQNSNTQNDFTQQDYMQQQAAYRYALSSYHNSQQLSSYHNAQPPSYDGATYYRTNQYAYQYPYSSDNMYNYPPQYYYQPTPQYTYPQYNASANLTSVNNKHLGTGYMKKLNKYVSNKTKGMSNEYNSNVRPTRSSTQNTVDRSSLLRNLSRDSGYTSPTETVPKPCENCSGPGAYICSGCQSVFYCSRKCQEQAWNIHVTKCGDSS